MLIPGSSRRRFAVYITLKVHRQRLNPQPRSMPTGISGPTPPRLLLLSCHHVPNILATHSLINRISSPSEISITSISRAITQFLNLGQAHRWTSRLIVHLYRHQCHHNTTSKDSILGPTFLTTMVLETEGTILFTAQYAQTIPAHSTSTDQISLLQELSHLQRNL